MSNSNQNLNKSIELFIYRHLFPGLHPSGVAIPSLAEKLPADLYSTGRRQLDATSKIYLQQQLKESCTAAYLVPRAAKINPVDR
jgi:hypothetical protein